jgi:hypothetical protein
MKNLVLFICITMIFISCNNKQKCDCDLLEAKVSVLSDSVSSLQKEMESYKPKDDKKKKEPKKKQYAVITSIADGYDVGKVNLWSSTLETRAQVGSCANNEKVEVLEYSNGYVKVKKSNGLEGWCMTGFLK